MASASWQVALGMSVASGAFGGAYYEHLQGGSLVEMLRNALVFGFVATLSAGVALRVRLAAVWALPSGERRQVIDAVRFGRSVQDRNLAGPLLSYTASATKWVRRPTIAAQAVVLGATAVFAAFVAVRCVQVGRVFDTVTYGLLSVAFVGLAVVWPEFGRICRRNIAAAEHSARAQRDARVPLVGSGLP